MPHTEVNQSHRKFWTRCLIAGLLFLVCAMSKPVRADYLLDTGDMVEISVFGIADLRRQVRVNVDGNISMPFLGEVRAAKLTLTELRVKLSKALAENGALRDPNVTVELVEHRPFYISGDVTRAGAYPYRRGLTVRLAISIAGGLDPVRSRVDNPLLVAPELQGQLQSLSVEFVRQQLRAMGLNAEVGGTDAIDVSSLNPASVPPSVVARMIEIEKDSFALRLSNIKRQLESFDRAIASADKTIGLLDTGLTDAVDNLERQSKVSEQAVTNLRQGVSNRGRANEEARALAQAQSFRTELAVRLAVATREKEDLRRQKSVAVGQRELQLRQDLMDTTINLERIRSQLGSISQRLMLVGGGALREQERDNALKLTIFRNLNNKFVGMTVTDDTEVLPGDLIEISIKPRTFSYVPFSRDTSQKVGSASVATD